MTWLFLSLSIFLNIVFFFMWNPLSLGLLLIFQTIILSIVMGTMTISFWFLYLLILVFIGGMLVLFIYVTSIFPNEKFSFNQSLMLMLLVSCLTLLITIFMWNNFFSLNFNLNNMHLLNVKSNSTMVDTLKIFNSQNNILLIFLVNYLFYCMIIVIKMTNYFKGPLRKMN